MATEAVSWRSARSTLALGLCALLLALGASSAGCKKQAEPLPILGQVGAFSLINQNSAAVSDQTLRGKVWAAAFFFTNCPTICPRITRRMRELQVAAAQQVPALALVSISVDPEHDTPPVLLAYAKRFDADAKNWSFLTGDLQVIKRTVVDGFKLALDGKPDPAAENGGIIHGSHLVLVDRTLAIRGYYRSDDDDDLARLLADAARL
ncbi:MAG TPA: SCO family protein [Polyangiaceae bacterium]|nr:SCO family protein [Polyangiaceae bacterium]